MFPYLLFILSGPGGKFYMSKSFALLLYCDARFDAIIYILSACYWGMINNKSAPV